MNGELTKLPAAAAEERTRLAAEFRRRRHLIDGAQLEAANPHRFRHDGRVGALGNWLRLTEITTYPTVWVFIACADFVIFWKLILKRSLCAFAYTFLIFFVVGFIVMANLLAIIDGAVWGWVVESRVRRIGILVLMGVCLILGGMMGLSRLKSSRPCRDDRGG